MERATGRNQRNTGGRLSQAPGCSGCSLVAAGSRLCTMASPILMSESEPNQKCFWSTEADVLSLLWSCSIRVGSSQAEANHFIRFCSEQISKKYLGFVCLKHGFVKFGIFIAIGFENFQKKLLLRIRYRKKIGIKREVGFSIKNI